MSHLSTDCLNAQQRLAELELCIRHYHGHEDRSHWLNEYLDIGLYLASDQCQCLSASWQEGWLTRLYGCLLAAVQNPQAHSAWRRRCSEYLYQPFFALYQLYCQQPDHLSKLCLLQHEFNCSCKLKQAS